MNVPTSGRTVNVLNGTRTVCMNGPTKLQVVKVEPMLKTSQQNSSVDTSAPTQPGIGGVEVAPAMSANIFWRNFSGVAEVAIWKSAPDVGSAESERLDECSHGW